MKSRVYRDANQRRRLGARKCPWSVEWRENGRRRSKTAGIKADAEKFATLKRPELIDGAMGIQTRKRWAEFVEEYTSLKIAHFRSAESRKVSVATLERFGKLMRPQWVSQIDRKTLDHYVTKRLAGKGRNGDPISPETAKKDLRTIRAALNAAGE